MKNNKNKKVIPIISYYNTFIQKAEILKANKGKIGIYKWTCKESGKSYVGSSNNLSKRFKNYCCLSYIKGRNSMIYRALIKYGYSSFSLDILEYCEPNVLISREQYYIDLLKPEYNICKTAGSTLGFKHSELTKAKLSINKTGIKHDITFSLNLSKAKRGKKIMKSGIINIKPKVITVKTRLKMSKRSQGVSVKVFDQKKNFINQFSSMKAAAKHFGVDRSTISNIYRTGISYDDYIYKFEVKDIRIWVYDSNHKLIKIMDNLKKASLWYKIPTTTMHRYIKTGKLYKNLYYLYNRNSKPKP